MAKQVQVRLAVAVAEEGRLGAVAALGHVVGHARDDDASESGHAAMLRSRYPVVKTLELMTAIPQ